MAVLDTVKCIRLSVSLKDVNPGGIIAPAHGACSSMAESLTVDQVVVGSTPIRHPINALVMRAFFYQLLPAKGENLVSTPTSSPVAGFS